MAVAAYPKLRHFVLCAAGFAIVLISAAGLRAQMVSPGIDQPGQPFSYFSKPTDEIGVMGAEAATEITPEGYLRTGFGELMFFAGPELEASSVRIRTLEQGHLPIVHYEFARDGIVYSFTLFAATLDGKESGTLVNFIRVEMKNASHQSTRAIFSTGIRYDALSTTGAAHGDNRFRRPAEGAFPGNYRQIGEPFSRQWANSFDAAHFFRDGRVLYSFPLGYAARDFTLRDSTRDMHMPDLSKPAHLNVEPETPVGIVTYSTLLPPGAQRALDFKMPVVPTADPQILSDLDQAGFDAAKAQIIAYWNKILSAGMQIELPEAKAVDTFSTSLIYDLIAIDRIGPDFIQTVNKLHYHSFYLRDGADIVHSYDVTGYPQIARECLDFFAKSQKPDGNFLSQPQQYDGWGEAVWGYAQHYRITHDKAFAEWALPQIDRAVDWLHQARAADPLHIVPASDVRDNEYVPGHLTGYNFLALDGLRAARRLRLGQSALRCARTHARSARSARDGDSARYAGQICRRHYDLRRWRVPAPLPHHQKHHDGDYSRRSGAGSQRVLCPSAPHQLDQRRFRVQDSPLGRPQLRRQPLAPRLVRRRVPHTAAHYAGARRGQSAPFAFCCLTGVDRQREDHRGAPGADLFRSAGLYADSAAGWRGRPETGYSFRSRSEEHRDPFAVVRPPAKRNSRWRAHHFLLY